MRAALVATGESTAPPSLHERYPTPLLPLLDRPFIQYVVECLVDLGVTDFDFILSHLPERIEQLLGDGRRWGSRFTFHLARDPSHPYRFLELIGAQAGETPVLLAHADRLPAMQALQSLVGADSPGSVVLCWRPALQGRNGQAAEPVDRDDQATLRWTGWARLSSRSLKGLSGDLSEAALASSLITRARAAGELIEVPRPLSVQACDELLASQWAVLSGSFQGFAPPAKETEAGIWLARHVSLHPTARLFPPLYIGENCRIGEDVRLGPRAVIGHDCVLDTRSTVANSLVFPGSYVGEELELADVIVDRNTLINVRVGAAVPVVDEFILGSLSERHLRPWLGKLCSRALALGLLACTWPVLALTALYLKWQGGEKVWHSTEVVRLPTALDESTWQTFRLRSFCRDGCRTECQEQRSEPGWHEFLQHFLPALVNIVKGELDFVGVPPRRSEEIKALAQDWQALYLQTKVGIVTESYVYYGARATLDEQHAAEVFYSVRGGTRHDCRLLLGYIGRVLKGLP